MLKRWRSPILRLALIHTSIFLLAFLALGNLGFLALKSINEDAMQRTVRRDLADLHDWYGESGLAGLRSALEDRAIYADPDAFYLLSTQQNSYRVPKNLSIPPSLSIKPGWHDFDLETDDKTRPAVARIIALPDGNHLLVGHVAWERERLFSAMQRELGFGLFFVLLMAAALSYMMSRAVAKALASPLAVAKRFADGERKARVIPNGSGDKFDQLALHLNAMFARIEDLVDGIAHTTDAIAHDLRTPLTRLRTKLDLARSVSTDQDTNKKIDAAIAEADQLLSIFQAMLRLSRLEADNRFPTQAVNLHELTRDATELFEAVSESAGQKLRLNQAPGERSIMVRGDRDQLFQLLVNLLDNTIKYAPEESHVFLSLDATENHAILIISDDGPGIPVKDRDRVFDRFVRLESHRGSPGHGLGLPLARAIVRHHRGHIRLEDANPGLRVVIELPLLNYDAEYHTKFDADSDTNFSAVNTQS